MFAHAIAPNLRMEDWRRAGVTILAFALLLFLLAMPDMAHAATAGGAGFDGKFGPDATTVTNVDDSAKGWWRFGAQVALWLAIVGFAISICFFKAQGWWIPVGIFLLCLFGEKTVNAVKSMAGFTTTAIDGAKILGGFA